MLFEYLLIFPQIPTTPSLHLSIIVMTSQLTTKTQHPQKLKSMSFGGDV